MRLCVSCREKDDSLQKAVQRILSVWEERNVFEHNSLAKFKSILCKLKRKGGREREGGKIPLETLML